MRRLIQRGKKNPEVRLRAADIVRYIPQKKWVAEINAIQQWVRDNIRYTKDIFGVETLHSVINVLNLGYGDCDDQTMLISAMLESIGHPTRLKAVGFSKGSLSHIYAQVFVNGKWVAVETTMDKWTVGKEPKGIKNTMLMAV